MPVCYFNKDYEISYRCEYEVEDNAIEVNIEYNIEDEIAVVDGIQVFRTSDEYEDRDILIIDSSNKKNYLLKNAYYRGHNITYGNPDGRAYVKFKAHVYFAYFSPKMLASLPDVPKIKSIRIYSKAFNDLINRSSYKIETDEDKTIIELRNKNKGILTEVGQKNVKTLKVADTWEYKRSKDRSIQINFNGYIELEFSRRVKYDHVSQYVRELTVFMQLYFPDKFCINRITGVIDSNTYVLSIPPKSVVVQKKTRKVSVSEDLLNFLNRCYEQIPYRNSKTEIRNIPYIVLETSRNIEDNFLMFYRFIESFYKKQLIPGIGKTFISYSVREHYLRVKELSESQIEEYSQEIISLRNHYVHSGYYLRNSSLKIKFKKINGKVKHNDYTVNNIDIHWIYERTKILYIIAIDIIFRKMLGVEDYTFDRHF